MPLPLIVLQPKPVAVVHVRADEAAEQDGMAKAAGAAAKAVALPIMVLLPIFTKPLRGNPVAFVKTPDAGVPRAGVTSVGDVARTTLPLPVELVSVGACAAAPVPVLV